MKTARTLAGALLLAAGTAAAGVHLEIGAVVPVLPYGAVSMGVGHGHYWRHGGWWYQPWGPQWIVVAPPPPRHRHLAEPAATSVVPTLPDPVITARNGQDANQAEYDRQQCNRWAVTQPAALADAAEFQRTLARCLDGLGYTMK